VLPYIGNLKASATCDGPGIDLSNRSYACQIRKAYEDTIVLASPIVTGYNGYLTMMLPYIETEVLLANVTREELPATDDVESALQDITEIQSILRKGYVYQTEELMVGGKKNRVLEGRVFVPREVVRV
jgi:hypothetical protein